MGGYGPTFAQRVSRRHGVVAAAAHDRAVALGEPAAEDGTLQAGDAGGESNEPEFPGGSCGTCAKHGWHGNTRNRVANEKMSQFQRL